MDNVITLVGNVTRDPELRFTPGGQAKSEFGLAVNRVNPNNIGNTDITNESFTAARAGVLVGRARHDGSPLSEKPPMSARDDYPDPCSTTDQVVNRGPGTYAISEDARGNLCIFLPDGRHVSAISWGTVSR